MTSLKAVEQRAKIIAKNNNDLNQCIDNNALPKILMFHYQRE